MLAIISRSKDNKTMKFGQLIEYNMRNPFLEKLSPKFGVETIPRPFSKKSKLSISLDQQFKSFVQFVFIVFQVQVYLKILKLGCRALAFTSYKAFLKSKEASGTSLSASFSAKLLKKKIYLLSYSINWPISLSGCLNFVRY